MADHSGDLAATLGVLTLVATGLSPYVADLNATLGSLSLAATGDSPAVGDLAVTLGALTLSGQGGAHLTILPRELIYHARGDRHGRKVRF